MEQTHEEKKPDINEMKLNAPGTLSDDVNWLSTTSSMARKDVRKIRKIEESEPSTKFSLRSTLSQELVVENIEADDSSTTQLLRNKKKINQNKKHKNKPKKTLVDIPEEDDEFGEINHDLSEFFEGDHIDDMVESLNPEEKRIYVTYEKA
eukprot:UN34332